jgi:hypothetical protein
MVTKFKDLPQLESRSPEQSSNRIHRCSSFEAERRMLQEILLDAIECWQFVSAITLTGGNYVTSLRERLYWEADFWIFGEYDNAPFFSFTQTCDCLGLNPEFIRRQLLEWRRKAIGPVTAASSGLLSLVGSTQG